MGRVKKQRREAREAAGPGPPRQAPPKSNQWVQFATLGGVAAVLALTWASARDIGRISDGLDDRLGKIESRLARLATQVDKLPAQERRGLDPNKVYQVSTAGSPAKGPAGAPVTIAEFSDFQ